MSRFTNFDCLRILAVMGIVLDHYVGGPIGSFLGETFICVLFCLSALLFGLKWNNNGKSKYKLFPFLFPRYIRLSVSLYPFLFAVFVFFHLYSVPFTLKDVVMNFAFLSWFDKLPKLGHLWFLTMILLCYIMFAILSKLHTRINWVFGVVLFGGSLILQYLVQKNGLPGYVFIILYYCGALFLNADEFLRFISRMRMARLLPVYLAINILSIVFFHNEHFANSPVLSKWIGSVCGICNLILFLKVFINVRRNSLIIFLSAISYEIYLVHNPLCGIEFSVGDYIFSPPIAFVAFIGLTAISACLLHWVSEFLYTAVSISLAIKTNRKQPRAGMD